MNTAEEKLILGCSRINLTENDIQRIRQYAHGVSNWKTVLQLAEVHGVLSIVYRSLKKAAPDLLPEDTLERLKSLHRDNAAKNLSGAATLLNILDVFKKNSILAVPFKGPLAAEQIYGDVGLRTFCDLDIFIKKTDAIKAKKLLMGIGYLPDIDLPPEKETRYLEFENSFSFYHPSGAISVDLHWEMTGRYLLKPLYLVPIENELEPFNFMGQEIKVIPYDLILVYLCTHGTSHCWERFEWLCGFSEMLKQRPNKLSSVLNLAKAMGCRRMFWLGLHLGHELLDVEIPPNLLNEISKDHGIINAATKIKQIMLRKKAAASGDAEWRFSSLHISLRDSYRDRLKYALYLYTAPTIKEWSKLSLPSCMTPLYRCIRPLRLGTAYLAGKKEKDA